MTEHRIIIWPAITAAALCLLDIALRLWLNPWEGKNGSIVVHDPGKSFFHLFILPAAVYVLCSHYQWHRDQRIGPGANAKLALLFLAFIAVAGAVVETRDSFKHRLTTAEDIADYSLRERIGVDRSERRAAVMEKKVRGAEARDAANKVANEAVVEAISKAGSWWQAISARRVSASLLAALGYGLAGYVIWLLAATALGVFPWESTRGHLLLAIVLLGSWPMLNGYSEIWRNFGSPPTSNPAQDLALLMLGFTGFLTWIAFSKADGKDLIAKITDSAPNLAAGVLPTLSTWIYRWSDPALVQDGLGSDSVNFGVAQLIAGSLLVIVVMVVETRTRGRRTP